MEETRLQKFISDCGIMSRRAAEAEIEKGNFTVNGITARIGQKINTESDTVEYFGKKIVPNTGENYTYIMLNKPRGVISSAKDDRGRTCVTDIVKIKGKRLYPVGRLDYNSDGLILMTDDGEFTNKLTHPKHKIPKIYHVTVSGTISENEYKTLSSPLIIDGYKIRPVKVDIISSANGTSLLRMELYEGRNRQIRKMCDIAGLKVLSLTRIAIGNVTLSELRCGTWRYLTDDEINYLKKES